MDAGKGLKDLNGLGRHQMLLSKQQLLSRTQHPLPLLRIQPLPMIEMVQATAMCSVAVAPLATAAA